jgi:hypothetical protein
VESIKKYPLYDLIIENCKNLTQLRIDEKVFKCRITDCKGLTTVVVKEQIGHLIIREQVTALQKIVNWSKVVCPELSFPGERVYFDFDQEMDAMIFAQSLCCSSTAVGNEIDQSIHV